MRFYMEMVDVYQCDAGRKGGLSQTGSGFGRIGQMAGSYVVGNEMVRVGCAGGIGGGGGETLKWGDVWGSNDDDENGVTLGCESLRGVWLFLC